MGKIKRFFQRTGVALAILACTIIGTVKLAPALTDASMFQHAITVAGGLVGAGVLMAGCGIGKAIQSSKEKKLLEQYNGPQIESPKQTAQGFNNGYNNANGSFSQKMSQTAERITEKVGQGANKLGIEMGKLFNNNNRPNTSANPYSSTVNHSANPYSSTDRMSAGYGGRYNGQNYNASMTGDVRDAARTGQQGGYYSGNNQQYNYANQNNNRQYNNNPYNNGQYNNARQNNNQRRYENVQGGQGGRPGQNGYNGYAPNSGSYNQNVQYGGGNNQNYRPGGNMNNQNVQYGNYQNGGSRPAPNTSGLEESAKSNYFENEPGSSSYRSGPLKKER